MPVNFDHLAPFYRLMERLLSGSLAQKARLTWIDQIPSEGEILLLGEGPGRFLEALIERFPQRSITCLDLSPTMIEVAQRVLPKNHQVHFQIADAQAWPVPHQQYSVLVSHFFWDCFPSEILAKQIPRYADSLKPDGLWLITDFSIPERGWKKRRAQLIHRMMYLFFQRFTGITATRVTPLDPHLKAANFTLSGRKTVSAGLIQADVWKKQSA